ncbi:MAG TPA: hypothetical protein DCY82_00430, partial [Acidimicrobiaceae bacterium]|nr:hypothetical protein [Acidimicrobiaceae bacterium]
DIRIEDHSIDGEMRGDVKGRAFAAHREVLNDPIMGSHGPILAVTAPRSKTHYSPRRVGRSKVTA